MTKLFIVDSNTELFIPNRVLEGQKIENLSRPAPSYYGTLKIPMRADNEPYKVIKIISEVVLAHPDTLGDIDEKLKVLNLYYKYDETIEISERIKLKKKIALERLIAEQNLNKELNKIKLMLTNFIEEIKLLEKGGWEKEEIQNIQNDYLNIVKIVGFEAIKERQGKRRVLWLEEANDLENRLIGLLRTWYTVWFSDPDLTEVDAYILREEWERKITLLKLRMNKLYQKILYSSKDERRLDDYVGDFVKWLDEQFKSTQTLWQAPKVWSGSLKTETHGGGMLATVEFIVKYYVDNIKLEQCQRGNRVRSELQSEIMRQLKQAYLYR
jgi:MscS family membrane protein